jgi:monoamine oxidase
MNLIKNYELFLDMNSTNYFQTIVVGGGISGLNILYNSIPYHSYALFEKNNHFGGRIKTFRKNSYIWEEGAGRFNQKHHRLLSLIKSLHLEDKMINIPSSIQFLPSNSSNKYSSMKNPFYYIQKVYHYYQKHKNKQKEYKNKTYIEYAKRVLTKKEIQYLLDSFGYESELNKTNAEYAIHLFKKDFLPSNQFMTLKGGLDQIIQKIVSRIEMKSKKYKKKYPNQLFTSYQLQKIKYNSKNKIFTLSFLHHHKIKKYTCSSLVLALPKYSLQKISYLKKIYKDLEKIECIPLLRTYAVYPPKKSNKKKVWFDEFTKTTTDDKLKYIIPIDKKKGVIMISYTDGKYALEKHKLNELNLKKEIKKGVKVVFGKEIGDPKILKRHYWDCGVALWKKGNYDYHQISKKMIRPYKKENLYICGENYSMNQGWIEGALNTSDLVIKWLNQSSNFHS